MITGGVKFFEGNALGLSAGGAVVDTLGTGAAAVQYLIGKSRYGYWKTVGSNDSTTETLTFTFPSAAINRLFVVDHNWKEFTAKYWDGSAYQHFTGVLGMDAAKANVSETTFADDTAYYEFDLVTTTKIQITIAKTQIAAQEKQAVFVIATKELGTLKGFPKVSIAAKRNAREFQTPSGKSQVMKAPESYRFSLDFSPYSTNPAYEPDLKLVGSIHERDVPFLIWPCGGRRGLTYFGHALREMRLKDIFLAQLVTDLSGSYQENNYRGLVNLGTLEFAEHA